MKKTLLILGIALTSLTIPTSVISIGTKAFKSCGNLTSLTIPNLITTIEADTFINCVGDTLGALLGWTSALFMERYFSK